MPHIFTNAECASAIVVPLLMLKNTVDGFLGTEFRIVECSPKCSIHYVNAVRCPVLRFHLNKHVNNMWRNRKTFLKWYSVPTTGMRRLSTRLGVSPARVRKTWHEDCLCPFHPQRVQNLHPGDNAMHLEFCHWLQTNRPLLLLTP